MQLTMEGTRVAMPLHLNAAAADAELPLADDEQLLAALYNSGVPEEASFSFVIGKPDENGFYRCPNGTCERK